MSRAPPAAARSRRPRRALLVAAAALLLLPLVAEVGVRLAGVRFRLPIPCAWNPRLGCMLNPDASEEIVLGRPFAFRTNADGRRDPPRGPKAPGARRILVLGDSVAFGAYVTREETFEARLEARLAARHVEVINGSSIYLRGTEQQLSYFVDVGAALQPDLVLLEFSARNDFADNAQRAFWKRGPAGLERVAHTDPTPFHARVLATNSWPIVHFLDDHSRLFGLFRVSYWNIMHLPHGEDWADKVPATEDVVARLAEEVAKAGARLAIVMVPNPETVERLRRGEPVRPDADETTTLAIAARHAIPLLDLTPLILAAGAADPVQDDDGHLTVSGHAAVAAALEEKLPEWAPALE